MKTHHPGAAVFGAAVHFGPAGKPGKPVRLRATHTVMNDHEAASPSEVGLQKLFFWGAEIGTIRGVVNQNIGSGKFVGGGETWRACSHGTVRGKQFAPAVQEGRVVMVSVGPAMCLGAGANENTQRLGCLQGYAQGNSHHHQPQVGKHHKSVGSRGRLTFCH